MLEKSPANDIVVGGWRAVRATGELTRAGVTERIEPKVMDLLFLLASRPGDAFSKDAIMEALWPNVTVGDDTLARAVSRLRKALNDDAKTPAFIETLPKRGYRLIAEVRAPGTDAVPAKAERPPKQWPVIAGAVGALGVAVLAILALPRVTPPAPTSADTLVERANDFYFQYKRAENEAAISLFERILVERPDHAPALAGLANALVQKVIRWPDEPGAPEYTKLEDALKSGRTKTPGAVALLTRAQVLAARAVAIAPDDPVALKALGFVQSASGQLDQAIATYQRAVARDADAWGPLINIGDVLDIMGRPREALPYFERAYAAMGRLYDKESVRIRPWYAELGVLIADRHREGGAAADAETWYRRVLTYAPLHKAATEHLAALLRAQGQAAAATALCANLQQRAGIACGP